MGDAVLGLVASQMGTTAPRWVAVRNVSDPQIKAEGTPKQQAALAAQIYKGFGRRSSVCSAIVWRPYRVKRHFVCKRLTIGRGDENSNGTPWSAKRTLNSDRLKSRLR